MTDLERAKCRLLQGGFTCVLRKGPAEYTSLTRGVKPLVLWLEDGTDLSGFSAADKVVGKATAFLYVLAGVSALYAAVISESALEVLQHHGIRTEYGEKTTHIINRTGDGICPFESAVLQVDSAEAAYTVIREKMTQMHL